MVCCAAAEDAVITATQTAAAAARRRANAHTHSQRVRANLLSFLGLGAAAKRAGGGAKEGKHSKRGGGH